MSHTRPALTQTLKDLKALLGSRLQQSRAICEQHGQGEDSHGVMPPDAVAFPHSNEEVAAIVRCCRQHQIPMIPYGTGTSVEGHLLALEGGISLDLSQMNKVLAVHAEDMDCRVQAGVTREQLNTELRHSGLFFPVDPGANASIGGMAATRASGTTTVRYGSMMANVMGLTVVTAQGEIITTGSRARKSAAGYDLTHLYVGSEGTLGVITEVHLRLHPIPELIRAAVCTFTNLDAAVQTVIEVMQCAIPVARMELLNGLQMQACIQYSKLEGFDQQPTLFFEFHGSQANLAEQIDAVKAIATGQGGSDFRWAEDTEQRNALWAARHNAYFAAKSLWPGCEAVATDLCVPISNLAESIRFAEQTALELELNCPVVGHVGDGNFHMLIMFDAGNDEQRNRADSLSRAMVKQALTVGGTCTGEHGIGVGKKAYLEQEHGQAVELMKLIKRALDPDNLMNPGKVLNL
ncbi:FAD-binding protein [Aestuariirhabdus sp. Z084]|uniref:FAD-binding oxidoreductase n=1 Tax=Aestuariirhabdus haliotis TaxID=2918751 RepID=UPI00201B37F0|nr:FAD-linked oxidase C-terminal domain-containing protein [Aestuariirhabdus haliotis]MCL6417289.1 FAD-binding protein [Aestuariirhabdus haliotis]MCL6421234.1 FAD-binding protein [Aestuariirhabdus haliotis]